MKTSDKKIDGWIEPGKMEELGVMKLPTLPKEVAEWLEYCVNEGYLLHMPLNYINAMNAGFEKAAGWVIGSHENQNTLAFAWLFGYEIEQEKRYEVIMPGMKNYNNRKQKLCYSAENDNYFMCGEPSGHKHTFTKAELEEAGFSWVWEVPEIIKEEV